MKYMPWKSICLICPALLLTPAYALMESGIDEKIPIPITFSKASHNRIAVEHGSVEKIFGDETYFNISIDRTIGNAFINVLRDITEPTTLTVVTGTGLIQDLAVVSANIPSEHLILKEKEEEKEELIETTSNFHGATVEFLNQILEGKSPLGYGQRAFTDAETLRLPPPLSVSPIKVFEGPFEEVAVYSIKNTGKNPIIIDAQSLKKGNISWVFCNAHELKAKEQIVCIVAFTKSEN